MNFSKIVLSVVVLTSIVSADGEKRLADPRGVKEIGRTTNTVTVEVADDRVYDTGYNCTRGHNWYTYEAEMNDDLVEPRDYEQNAQIITDVKCDRGSLGMQAGWILTHINNKPYTKALEASAEKELDQSKQPYTMTFCTHPVDGREHWSTMKKAHGRELRQIDPNFYKNMCKQMEKLLELGARDGPFDEEEMQQAVANMTQASAVMQQMQAASIPASVPDTRVSTSSASSTAPAKKKNYARAR